MDERSSHTRGTRGVTEGRGAPRSRVSGLWTGLVLSAVVLVFLLVFIMQNTNPARINFLGWDGVLPTGVALLFAAIAGVLLVAIPGSIRILQLRHAAARDRERHEPAVLGD
jgi:lipopolysaccharide assembly protein A